MNDTIRIISEKGELLCQNCGNTLYVKNVTKTVTTRKYPGENVLTCLKCGSTHGFRMVDVTELPHLSTDKITIAKAPEVFSKIETGLKFFEVENEPSAIMVADFGSQVGGELTFTQVPYFIPGSENVRAESIAWYAKVMKIVIEFDYTKIEVQVDRAQKVANLIDTPMFAVMSGNKSVHLYIYFQPFAKNPSGYKDACFGLYAWLCEQLPSEFKYYDPDDVIPKEDRPFVPDFSMWQGSSRWTRQAQGYNKETNQKQFYKIYHNRSTPLQSITDFSISKGEQS